MRQQRNKGFTLVEVIVAFVILGIAGGTILNSFAMAIRLNVKAEQEFRTANCARIAMEYLLHLDGIRTDVNRYWNALENEDMDTNMPNGEGFVEIPTGVLTAGTVPEKLTSDIVEALGEYDDLQVNISPVKWGRYQRPAAVEDNADSSIPARVDCQIQITITSDTGDESEWTGIRRIILTKESEGDGT